MKKISLLISLFATICNLSFSQSNHPLIDSFLSSTEYSRIRNSTISAFGNVDFQNSSVFTGTMGAMGTNDSATVVNIVLSNSQGLEGVIQAIPLPIYYNNVLPGNEHYVMILYDYRYYDTTTKTGSIKLIDLNYDDWIPLELTVSSGVMTTLQTHFMPNSTIKKYADLLKKKDLGNPIYNEGTLRAAHYCDQNGNGNVSYGECFRCLASSCFSNQNCSILCGITNLAGQWLVGVQACTASIATSCVWISIWC